MEIGIVTCEKCPTLSASDRSLIPAFQEAGATATPLVWNDPAVNWSSYDFLLIRSIWDYHLHPAAFVRWINRLEEEKIITLNPVSVMRRNYHKFYLRELEASGVRIIPTLFLEKSSDLKLPEGLPGWNKVVIKPAISASGGLTSSTPIPARRESSVALRPEKRVCPSCSIRSMGRRSAFSKVHQRMPCTREPNGLLHGSPTIS